MADLKPWADKARRRLTTYQNMQAFVGDSAEVVEPAKEPPADRPPDLPVIRRRGSPRPKTFINALTVTEQKYDDGGSELIVMIDMEKLEKETKVYQFQRRVAVRIARGQSGHYVHLDYTTPL